MLTVVCVYFDGGDQVPAASRCFDPSWVDKLYRAVKRNLSSRFRFVCLTHRLSAAFHEAGNLEVVPFLDDNRKWTCLMECFRPDVVGDHNLLLGLDTIVAGPIDKVASYEGRIALCRARGAPVCTYNNAVMGYSRECAAWLWSAWQSRTPEEWGREYTILGKPSELAFIDMMVKQPGCQPDLFEVLYPDDVVCYRGAKDQAIAKARIVWFYGNPKNQHVHERRLKEAWV